MKNVSIVIPAYNEAKTIAKVIRAAKKSRFASEIVVVDDGSTDTTAKTAKREGVKVFRHKKNKGKGAAIRSGVKHSKGSIILFLDADIENITPKKIDLLIKPVAEGEADFVKAGFKLSRGRVTEIAVKPLLRVLDHELDFSQPISGQFCLTREFIESSRYSKDWGVDIEILLEAVARNQRILEVELGNLKHKKLSLPDKAEMSQQVMEKILQRHGLTAGRYALVVFDLDETLVGERTIDEIAYAWGFLSALKKWRSEYRSGKLKERYLSRRIAREFKGRTRKDIERVLARVPLRSRAKELVTELKRRKYEVAIISLSFDHIAKYYARKLGIKKIICPELVTSRGRYTGKAVYAFEGGYYCVDKGRALKKLASSLKIKPRQAVFVGNGPSDVLGFREAGLSVAITPASQKAEAAADEKIDSLSELLLVLNSYSVL